MRILDRYILKSVLGVFLTCLFVFIFLYVIIDVFTHLEDMLRQRVPALVLLQYYLSFVPIIFMHVTPIACLLSALYTFGKLNRDNEVIAMRSSGLSILQIAKTAVVFGIIISVFYFWIGDRFVPQSQVTTEAIKAQMESGTKKAKEKHKEVVNNLYMYGMKNRLFSVNKFSPETNTMEGIIILEHNLAQNIILKVVANKGVYKDGSWTFYQSITYEFDENGQIRSDPRYMEEEVMSIPESPQDFLDQRQKPELMNIAQLEDYIWRLSKSGAVGAIRSMKVDLYERYSRSFTAVIMILLGIPFSLIMRRRATGLSSVGISLIMGFLYYVLNAISLALGKANWLTPMLAASFSHIVAFLSSVYLISKLP